MSEGYVFIKQYGHPRAHRITGYVQEHILVAEQSLGRFLPPQAVVHHINEIRSDNRSSNLVICEDRAYHVLLHQRMRAYAITGDASMRKCYICKQYDEPKFLKIYPNGTVVHMACGRKKQAGRRRA